LAWFFEKIVAMSTILNLLENKKFNKMLTRKYSNIFG